ncbi:similar to stress responsive alpha-beta barrel domain-containing protein [Plenodomus lingam JN3]|uniref:Similar to stress responsive alpha-beta barrel domain-containing protein n=2 Tax=Leptosphaeria maculans TaxID=5022 RepID=E4ZP67_LEPMJ|nr:similar to stress responsive alpha-beta barrel domain-containing protein [Plenodomus lingam JN3]CBX93092.1 similar to stress responsive alpha-beta barrel domain-containing protein [Plenodomus lingam JN3]
MIKMSITHIVLFEWKSTASSEQVEEACKRMLALGEKCIHPTSQKPYIKAFTGGKNNSPEGRSDGLTHGFVVEFESAEDRDYYTHRDPAHQAFVQFVGPLVQGVKVLDYTPGVF